MSGNSIRIFVIFTFSLLSFLGWGQSPYEIKGKVIEARTGSPIPFANVLFSGSLEGTTTDFDGNFRIVSTSNYDSLEVRYIGFITKKKVVLGQSNQTINFQLEEDIQTLGEVVVYAGENPAFPIMRNVAANRKLNDKRSLEAYEYEAYTKIEVDVDNMSDRLKRRRLVQKITSVLDSIEQIAGEDGKPVLPIFLSEAISRFYYRNNPTYRHEHILKTKITGVGLTDGTTTSQIIGSTLQEYNFYQNWLNILSKEFVSPIAEGWRLYYDYDLVDSLELDGDFVYRLDFFPKNSQDLAFQGTMWITKDDYALKRIDASVLKSANLNYIEKIKIQQDLYKTSAGPWIPEKSRVVVDVSQLTKSTAGFIGKFYVSARDFKVNEVKSASFYQNPVKMELDAQENAEDYWVGARHDSLTTTESNVYEMIDTLKAIPFVKLGMDGAKFAATGYYKTGPVDLGPYSVFYGDNDIEGQRIGMGMRTNFQFSKKLTLGGYYAYGFLDERSKYMGYVDLVLDREKWSNIRFERRQEVDQIWSLNQDVSLSSFFFTFSRFGNLRHPFFYTKNRLTYNKHLWTGLNQTFEFKQQSFTPLFDFSFDSPVDDNLRTSFSISEVRLATRWGKDEIFVINDNERWSLGSVRWPIITFDYTYGIPNLLGSDLSYHRFKLRFQKRQKLAVLGVSRFDVQLGAIYGEVPYPLLFNHLGNETPAYARFSYNLMNFFEFSSDQYVSFRYRHNFEGLLLNKVPLIRKLKFRAVGSANIVYGNMRNGNRDLVNYPLDQSGNSIIPFYTLGKKPYAEIGYGVENILKILRVDFFHRLTYLDHPMIDKFGVKFSFQFVF